VDGVNPWEGGKRPEPSAVHQDTGRCPPASHEVDPHQTQVSSTLALAKFLALLEASHTGRSQYCLNLPVKDHLLRQLELTGIQSDITAQSVQ
jgi:hypothetical protein